MLILTRKQDEKIYIGEDVVITLCELHRKYAQIGIEAPREVTILRGELLFTHKAHQPPDGASEGR